MSNKLQKRARAFNFPMPSVATESFVPKGTLDVITSCSLAGWHKYGEKSIKSFVEFWPQQIKLHLVSEDPLAELIPVECRSRVLFHSLSDYIPGNEFFERHKNNKAAHGYRHHTVYNFREDAYRFCKKVFAIRLVTRKLVEGRIIWLDADTFTMSAVPLELLYRMPPDNYNLAFLYRGARYHSECGFVGYNLNQSRTHDFITKFSAVYETDRVFELKEWHDSWIFDWLRNQMGIGGYEIPHSNVSHPFVHSELGKYIDHLKGRRKDQGFSPELKRKR